MKAVIFDIEIEKCIPSRQRRLAGLKYCEGWRDFEGMGISCLCAYDYYEDRYRVFTDSNHNEFEALWQKRDLFVGFNSIPFDSELLEACWELKIPHTEQYDILREMWKGANMSTTFSPRTHGGFSLDATAEKNLDEKKSGSGANAPIHWQKGKVGNVVDYCLKDVWLTKRLFDRVLKTGALLSPKTDQPLSMRKP